MRVNFLLIEGSDRVRRRRCDGPGSRRPRYSPVHCRCTLKLILTLYDCNYKLQNAVNASSALAERQISAGKVCTNLAFIQWIFLK